jgi:hypothetical protein
MATISAALVDRPSGATLTGTLVAPATCASGGDSFVPSGNSLLMRFNNASGGVITVTFNSVILSAFPGGVQASDIDPVLSIAAGAVRVVRFQNEDFPRFTNVTTGLIDATYSVNPPTGLTVETYQLVD